MQNKITSIGEILYDVYPDQKRLGGAPFNFIYHIWKILGVANFISSVGNDDNGKEILAHLNSINFDTSFIAIDRNHPTGTVRVSIDETKIPHYIMARKCSFDYMVREEGTNRLFEESTDLLSFGTLTMRDEISRDTILSMFNKTGKKYFCDLNLRHDFFSKELVEKVLQTCNVIKINQDELNKLKIYFRLDEKNDLAVRQLINLFNLELVAITLGEEGAELYKDDEESIYKSSKGKIVDALGAGDAFSSILCIGYLHQMDLDELNKLANEFAFQICCVSGALPTDDSIYSPLRKIFA
jgi:fructokinase